MSLAGSLDKYWIDHNFSYLKNRLGLFSVFEPSGPFYDDLAQLGDAAGAGPAPARAAHAVFAHAGVLDIPVLFAPGMASAGEFQFSHHPGQPGGIIPVSIRVSDKYRTIKDPQARGMAVGTILAHEVAHYCLMKNGILRETTDNERLTDLGLMVLGLGKLYFNGRNLVVEERKEHLGYLKPLDMTYAFMEYARHNGISPDMQTLNLSKEARQVLLFWLGQVNTGLDAYKREEAISADEEDRLSVLARLRELDRDVQKAGERLKTLRTSLAATAQNQEIISKTIRFWEIDADGRRAMEEFVAALSSGAYEADLTGISRPLVSLEQELVQLAGELQPGTGAGKDWNLPRNRIAQHTRAAAALNDRMTTVQKRLSAAGSVHRQCFLQIAAVMADLETTRTTLGSCRKILTEIRLLHEFFSINPAAWPGYAAPSGLSPTISGLVRSGEQERFLSRTGQEAEQVASFLSVPKEKFPEHFGTSPPLHEIAGRARSERDGAAAALQTLQHFLASQEDLTRAYLEEATLLESRLQDTLAAATLTGQQIQGLRPRQDRIYAQYRTVRIAPEDAREFQEITEAICSCSPDADLAHARRILAGIRTAVQQDAVRVKHRSEGTLLLPVETHWKQFTGADEDLRMLSARIVRWTGTQQVYLDRLRRREQRSPAYLLRNLGTRIKKFVQAWVPGPARDAKK